MKIGIMGGTFDPVHIGHMLAAEAAYDTYRLDRVWFMPSHVPPHKQEAGIAGEERLQMVKEAVRDHPAFEAIDHEIRRGGISYTFQTLRELQMMHPDAQFYFIIGADMVNYLPHWDHIEELAQRLVFIGVRRPGYELVLDGLPTFLHDRVMLAEMPVVDISSTDIRERIAAGHSVRYMVPDRVYEYMTRGHMYEI